MAKFYAPNRRFPVGNLFVTVTMVLGMVALPIAASAAPVKATGTNTFVNRQSDKPPFQYKANASVQKGIDLLKKYGLPESSLKDLVNLFCDTSELTKVLQGLTSPKLTDAQIGEFVAAAHTLATDKTDPLTTEAFKAWVADGMATSLKDKKVPTKDGAKLAILGGEATKPGSKTDHPSLKDISAAVKQAEPTLSDNDIADLLFWYSLGYDQIYFEVFQVISLREELTYYDVPPEEIKAIIDHFDDPQATDAELAKVNMPGDIRQSMLDNYNEKLAELGPQACGCAALQAIQLAGKALLESNGVPLADQLAIQQAFEKGDMAEVAKLATAAGVPADQLQEFAAATEEVKTLAGADYQAFVADQQNADQQAVQDPAQLDQSINNEGTQPQQTEPTDRPLDDSSSS